MAENKSKTCEERSELYSFLAGIYSKEPTKELIETLGREKSQSVIKELGFSFGKNIQETNVDSYVDELVLEYTRLFIGPGKHISPNASVWCESSESLWTETTVWVKELIESAGLEYNDSWHGMPDHIGIEFEFMSKLILYESSARKNSDTEQITMSVQLEKKFVHDHLIKWVPLFCDKIIEKTDVSFYSEIAQFTKKFIENEAQHF